MWGHRRNSNWQSTFWQLKLMKSSVMVATFGPINFFCFILFFLFFFWKNLKWLSSNTSGISLNNLNYSQNWVWFTRDWLFCFSDIFKLSLHLWVFWIQHKWNLDSETDERDIWETSRPHTQRPWNGSECEIAQLSFTWMFFLSIKGL